MSLKRVIRETFTHIHTDEEIERAARKRLGKDWENWQFGVMVCSDAKKEGERMFSVFHKGKRCYHNALPEIHAKHGSMAYRDIPKRICSSALFHFVVI